MKVDIEGRTFLHWLAKRGTVTDFEVLVETRKRWEYSPLTINWFRAAFEWESLSKAAGGDPSSTAARTKLPFYEIRNDQGLTAMDEAAERHDHADMILQLLDEFVDTTRLVRPCSSTCAHRNMCTGTQAHLHTLSSIEAPPA